MGEAVLDELVRWTEGLADAPTANLEGALEAARTLRRAPADRGAAFAPLLAETIEAARHGAEYSSPGYLAYVPGGGLFASALGEFLGRGLNRFVGMWQQSPPIVQIEENVTRWLCDLFSMPAGAQGILTTGGSMATLSAVVTARHERLGPDFLDGTYYVTDQSHASVSKAATIAGFSKRNLRLVPTDGELRMDPDALRAAVRDDRAAGMRPFLVVPAAGTTNTGAVDPLGEVADVAAGEGLWLHVDAAYGGFFQLTERGAERFRGIERADSITLDPHKGLFLPYGTGGLVVRDGSALRRAHEEGAAYLQDLPPAGELPNYNELSIELSREARGLRVWFPLVLHGVAAFREALDEKLDLAARLDASLREDDRLDLPWRPQLTVVPFRLRDADDDAQRALLARINASQRVIVSSTLVHGEYWLRACIVSHRTHADRVDECAAIVREAAATVAR